MVGGGRKLMPVEKVMTEAIGRIDSFSWGRLRNSIASLFILSTLVLVIPRSAWAQATASLNGTVRDSTGAVVPQADVTLHNTQTGTERKTETNDVGVYVIVSVVPGEYKLSLNKTVFAAATQENFTLLVALARGVNPLSNAKTSGGAQATPIRSFMLPAVNANSNRSKSFMVA